MYFVNEPGPWQYYVNRPDNIGLPIMEIKDKYMREQLLFEQQYNLHIQQNMSFNSQGGGPMPTGSISTDNTANSYVVDSYVEDYLL